MFHINGWCIPYAALVGGAKLVLPGPRLDGASLYEFDGIRKGHGQRRRLPRWLGLVQHLEQHGLRFSTLRRSGASGGSGTLPRPLIATLSERYWESTCGTAGG